VKRSTKAGIASAVLLLVIFIPPYREWRTPINLACAVLSCALGALAATSGRKWWLVIPASIVAGFVIDLYLVMYAL
jgi:fatty acid desaturase